MWMIIRIQSFFATLLSFLFPSQCYLCKNEGETLCTPCLQRLPKAIETPYPFIYSIYSFKNYNVKQVIHAIKYFHRRDLIHPLITTLCNDINNPLLQEKKSILVPIPMPHLRKYIRGHNHAESLAQELSKITGQPIDTSLLRRNKTNKRQVTTMSRKERIDNQKNAFSVNSSVENKIIILIDDVTTTGSTLYEARALLLKKGAREVHALTIAH